MSRVGWLWHRVVVHNKTECTNFAKNVQLVRISKSNLSTRRWLVVILALTHQWVSRQYIFFFRSFNFMSFDPCFVGDALKCFLILWTKLSGYIVAHSWPEISTNIYFGLVSMRSWQTDGIQTYSCSDLHKLHFIDSFCSAVLEGGWLLNFRCGSGYLTLDALPKFKSTSDTDISYINIICNTIFKL